MPRPRTVYRGKRKYSWIITLAVTLLVLAILLAVWLFYYLQRYIVYDKDGLRLDLSAQREELLHSGAADTVAPGPGSVPSVDVEIVVEQRDYSQIRTSAGEGLGTMHALQVDASALNENTLKYYSANMGDFDTLVLQLKTEDGFLHWHSTVAAADSYALNGTLELAGPAAALKEQGIRLAARLSILTDTAMAQRNAPLALKSAATGAPFADSKNRCYLDPYSDGTRSYLLALLSELKSLGFDEILLDGFICPDSGDLQFSLARTQTPAPADAVASLGLWLREQADLLGLKLSVVIDSAALHSDTALNGQSPELLLRIFDRVAVEVGYDTLGSDLAVLDAALDTGSDARILPITENFTPDRQSYLVR